MSSLKPKSVCVHTGTVADPVAGGINTPIFTSTSYAYLDTEKRFYPRYFNLPNQRAVIDKVCALEKGENGIVFGSGMAAISTTILTLLKKGDHAVFQPFLYGGTYNFIKQDLPAYGIEYTQSASQDVEDIKKSLTGSTRLIYIETPSNPLLNITDIKAVAALARARDIVTVIDSTFASPVNQNPLTLGIDVVIHSATKYLGGHSDICAGMVVADKKTIAEIYKRAINLGGSLDSLTCYLLERSLKTLFLRVEQQNQNALEIVRFLSGQPRISRVYYPGLPSHPHHLIAKNQMSGFGGMLSFELKDTSSTDFQHRLKLIKPSMSLGGVESIICAPAITSHRHLSPAERKREGITDGLLRLSVGIEDCRDLIEDLSQALKGDPKTRD